MGKAVCAWSGGKDSAMALHEVLKSKRYEVLALLTTLTEDYDRISMHGVRRSLLEQQAESLGIHLEKIYISKDSSNAEYESKMKAALEKYAAKGIESVIFGDIFLEDLKKYREEKLSILKMKGIFPVWKKDTKALAKHFLALGFKAIVTCVDSKILPKEFAGRNFDEWFLSELPAAVDPCGENGEFHSFVYDGPIFRNKIELTIGETVLRDNRYYFCDLLPMQLQNLMQT